MRDPSLALWRWVFGLALAPVAALAWLARAHPHGGPVDIALALATAYLGSLLVTALLAGAALAARARALQARDFLARLLGLGAGGLGARRGGRPAPR